MPRLYSNDLRWCAIWMVELLGYSVDEVAATLFMSPRTIERYISKCLNIGDVNSEKLVLPCMHTWSASLWRQSLNNPTQLSQRLPTMSLNRQGPKMLCPASYDT